MKKVYIWKDSAYPVYGVDDKLREAGVEIPDELFQRYLSVEKEYKVVQNELAKYSCE